MMFPGGEDLSGSMSLTVVMRSKRTEPWMPIGPGLLAEDDVAGEMSDPLGES